MFFFLLHLTCARSKEEGRGFFNFLKTFFPLFANLFIFLTFFSLFNFYLSTFFFLKKLFFHCLTSVCQLVFCRHSHVFRMPSCDLMISNVSLHVGQDFLP